MQYMGFKKLPDNLGMIYMPECSHSNRKHPCLDCFCCQWCGNERCRLCKSKLKKIKVEARGLPQVQLPGK